MLADLAQLFNDLIAYAGSALPRVSSLSGRINNPKTNASAVTKEILGQGASAVAPDRDLILQRRTFAPGADSGAQPAPCPVALFVDSGSVEFTVVDGAGNRSANSNQLQAKPK